MASPNIVFATTCKGRTQHLAQTLPANIRDNADYANCKFVVLDYCDPGPLRYYLRNNHKRDIDSGRLVVYHYGCKPYDVSPTDIPFHMAHAKNMAPRCGILEGADIVVTLDADNYTGPGLARFIAEQFREPGIFLCPDFWHIRNLPHGPGRPNRGFYGRLALRTQDFVKLGGYDEIYSEWGSEDADMIGRLLRLGYVKRYFDIKNLNTIAHGAEVRFKEYPGAKKFEDPEYIKSLDLRKETVVNYGKIGLGTVYRNFDPDPIEITAQYQPASSVLACSERQPRHFTKPFRSWASIACTGGLAKPRVSGMRCIRSVSPLHWNSTTLCRTCRSHCFTRSLTNYTPDRSSS